MFSHFHNGSLAARLRCLTATAARILLRYLEAQEYIGGLLLCNQGFSFLFFCFFFSTAESWNRLENLILLESEVHTSQLELSLWLGLILLFHYTEMSVVLSVLCYFQTASVPQPTLVFVFMTCFWQEENTKMFMADLCNMYCDILQPLDIFFPGKLFIFKSFL